MSVARLITTLCLSLASVLSAQAQIRTVPADRLARIASPRLSRDSAALSFDTRHIVAEPMNEDDAPSTYRYVLTNVGDAPLEIKGLKTTCSCLIASCTKRSLLPEETAEIVVRYDPSGHPGRFERKIFVYTQEGDDPSAVLRLSADVKTGSDLSGMYPVQKGTILLRRDAVSFVKGEKAVEKIRFINAGDRQLKLECEPMFLPGYLDFEVRPQTLAPQEEGEIVISYDPSEGGEKAEAAVILKGLGVPPRQSSIKVIMKL